MPVRLASFVLLMVFHLTSPDHGASAQKCGDSKSSIMHYALLEHAYDTSVVEEYPSCMKSCMADAKCASCNYDLTTMKCEFSNTTKATAPDKFVKKDYSIYTEMLK